MVHIEHWVRTKEWGNAELKIIVSHNLGNGVRAISEWFGIYMGSGKEFFLQMKLNFVAHLKLVLQPILIMLLLVLSIGFLQNLMDLLADLLNPLNEFGGFVGLRLNMGRLCLCGGKS